MTDHLVRNLRVQRGENAVPATPVSVLFEDAGKSVALPSPAYSQTLLAPSLTSRSKRPSPLMSASSSAYPNCDEVVGPMIVVDAVVARPELLPANTTALE